MLMGLRGKAVGTGPEGAWERICTDTHGAEKGGLTAWGQGQPEPGEEDGG